MPSIFDVFPDLQPRSVLPSGGSPADDKAYLEWRTGFVDAVNSRWIDSRTRFGCDLPTREPVDYGRLDEHLFNASGGTRMFETWNHSHRQRQLAIAFKDHRRSIVRLAQQYAATRTAACREER